MQKLFGDRVPALSYYEFFETQLDGIPVIVTRTGWTGELGYEIYLLDPARGMDLWERVIDAGQEYRIAPTGPSDIRRIEAGILNYGVDMTIANNPYEVGLQRLVDLDKPEPFIGREALRKVKAEGVKRKLVGVELSGARLDLNMTRWPVRAGDTQVGYVSSAVYSPRLEEKHRLRDGAHRACGPWHAASRRHTRWRACVRRREDAIHRSSQSAGEGVDAVGISTGARDAKIFNKPDRRFLPAPAGTFVYVSNAEDGDIGTYRMQPDGALQPGARVKAADAVGPMAVSPDRRFLYAAVRSKPFSVHAYAIDPGTGALTPLSVSPLAESFPYISLDKTGRFLFGASYGAHLISVNAVGSDGRVAAEPLQVIPVGRNAHSIRIDESNKFVYVPTLGSDQMFQFAFDAKSGRLSSNTPAVAQMQPMDRAAPLRHLGRQQVPVRAERTAGHGHDLRAGRQDGPADRSELGIRAAARHQARARRAARGGRRTDRRAAAQPGQRHLGRGHPPDAERQVPLHLGAHQQHPGGVQRECGRPAN